jgi:urea transport system substrate-binding protein
MGERNFSETVQEIRERSPDVIFSTINGISNQSFFRELAAQKVSAEATPVISTSVGEDELRSMRPSEIEGHLATWNYLQSVDTPRNRRFIRRFKNEHGEDRVLSDPMESAYSQVYLWKLAVEKASSFDVDPIRDALATGLEFNAPGGKLKLDGKTLHAFKRCRIGRVKEDRQFELVYESAIGRVAASQRVRGSRSPARKSTSPTAAVR